MRQFVLPPDYSGASRLVLRGERRHYLIDVLRFKEGRRFRGIDPAGRTLEIELESIGPDTCTLAIRQPAAGANEPAAEGSPPEVPAAPRITLFQCIPKGKRMDLIVRQATEAGVARIVPVRSRHTVPRFDDREWEAKSGRWERVIREAMQQSGQSIPPVLEKPIAFEEIPARWESRGIGIFFHERPLAHKTLHEYLVPDALDIALAIGPEGGLAAAETQLLRDAGFGAVYLGESVLRVETATLFAIAAVRIVLLEKSRWKLNDR